MAILKSVPDSDFFKTSELEQPVPATCIYVVNVSKKLEVYALVKVQVTFDVELPHEQDAPSLVWTVPSPFVLASLAFSITLEENPTSNTEPSGAGALELIITSTKISIFSGTAGFDEGKYEEYFALLVGVQVALISSYSMECWNTIPVLSWTLKQGPPG